MELYGWKLTMKNKLYFTIFSMLALCTHNTYNLNMATDDTKLFSGSIEFPVKLNYDLCLFYNGQKLDFEANSTSSFIQFSFLDSKDTHTMYFIITNELTCCTKESNNVQCLCVTDESSYICYKMQAKREIDDEQHHLLTWEITTHSLQNSQIPHNSLIFLFDPALVAGLKVQSWKPENIFRIIPTLVIHPTATIEQIQRAIIIARLAALDVDAIHAKTDSLNPTHAVLTAMQ
jgi:hypothetical protein